MLCWQVLVFVLVCFTYYAGGTHYPLLKDAKLLPGFFAEELVNHTAVDQPRGLFLPDGTSDVLVIGRGLAAIVCLYDSDDDQIIDSSVVLAEANKLNHGLFVYNEHVYASSDTIVYRWPYTPGQRSSLGDATIVIDNINADGNGGAPQGHRTRTLFFDSNGLLFVSVGSAGNLDSDSYRSRIRVFDISDNTTFPLDFVEGHVFADGLRNEVGLALDKHQRLWGVENSADRLERDDLGGDIHNDNPAEELNRFEVTSNALSHTAKHYGYPYCWSEYLLPEEYSLGRGTPWQWPGYDWSDATCRDNTEPAALAMQAHSAPLGIVFYEYTEDMDASCEGTFPAAYDGHAFIAFHGSWNRDVPTGYKIVSVAMSAEGQVDTTDPVDVLWHNGEEAQWPDGTRPVDVRFDFCGRLVFTSDGTSSNNYCGSKVVRISYNNSDVHIVHPSSTSAEIEAMSSSSSCIPPPDDEMDDSCNTFTCVIVGAMVVLFVALTIFALFLSCRMCINHKKLREYETAEAQRDHSHDIGKYAVATGRISESQLREIELGDHEFQIEDVILSVDDEDEDE